MRTHRHLAGALFVLGLVFLALDTGALLGDPQEQAGRTEAPAGASSGRARDFATTARQIVNDSARVTEGESVLITGDPSKIPLMEAVAIEVAKKGAFPHMVLNSPNVNRKVLLEAPAAFLETPNKMAIAELKKTDVMITLSPTQDPASLAKVPEERVALVRKAGQAFTDAFYARPMRAVSLGNPLMPTPEVARFYGVTLTQLESQFWQAVNTTHAVIEDNAHRVRQALASGRAARIRTTAGTDLRFDFQEGADIGMSDGQIHEAPGGKPAQVWLPAGEVFTAPEIASVNGAVVVPLATYRGIKIRNLRLTFANGRVTDIQAGQNAEALREALNRSTGDKDVIAFVDIGVNPNSRPIGGADYYTYDMGGMVTIGIGEAPWADSPNRSDFSQDFHLPRATLEVDGQAIIRDGRLAI